MQTLVQSKAGQKIRGVNLGSWLVLEKWMVPSMFEGLAAVDETSFCVELGAQAASRLQQHWDTFITRDDFVWLLAHGINAVRIPVGHWIFGSDYPYHAAYQGKRFPYVEGGLAILDRAFAWAEELGLLVVLDLHAAPGCQNGFDNGGIKDVCEWHTRDEYLEFSLDILERLAERYGKSRVLHGIEVVNEPRWDIATDVLQRYTREAYRRIRKYCRAEEVAVVFHDGFRAWQEYQGFLMPPDYDNVVFDIHRYQCFVREDVDMDIYGHINKAAIDWKNEADDLIHHFRQQVYVGEWSLGLDLKVVALWAEGPFNHALQAMDNFQMSAAYRAYAAAQLLSFEKYLGWFFWSYKTETTPAWSFRTCVERGWMPEDFSFARLANL